MKCPHCGFSWDAEEWEDEEKPKTVPITPIE